MDRDRQILLPKGLVLRESPIEGLGVFAIQDFKKGHKFGDYTGVEMSTAEFKQRYGNDTRYTYRLRRINRIIVAKESRTWPTYVNDGVYKQDIPLVNTVFKKRAVYALTDIQAGDELLLDYGKKYDWWGYMAHLSQKN